MASAGERRGGWKVRQQWRGEWRHCRSAYSTCLPRMAARIIGSMPLASQPIAVNDDGRCEREHHFAISTTVDATDVTHLTTARRYRSNNDLAIAILLLCLSAQYSCRASIRYRRWRVWWRRISRSSRRVTGDSHQLPASPPPWRTVNRHTTCLHGAYSMLTRSAPCHITNILLPPLLAHRNKHIYDHTFLRANERWRAGALKTARHSAVARRH